MMTTPDAMEGVADGHAHGGPAVEFFAHALVEQHVVVHGHAHGQGQAGQAGQGEGGVDGDHHGHQHEHVQHQGDVGHHAGEAVVPEHEQRHEDRGDDHRVGALLDGVAAEGGTDEDVADRLLVPRAAGRLPALSTVTVASTSSCRHSRDLALLADPAADVGGRVEFAVEDDAQLLLEWGLAFVGQVAGRSDRRTCCAPIALKPKSTTGSPASPGALLLHVQVVALDVVVVLDDQHVELGGSSLRSGLCGRVTICRSWPNFFSCSGATGTHQPIRFPLESLIFVALGSARRLRSHPVPIVVVIELVGQNAELQRADAADRILDLLDLVLVAHVGNGDFDLVCRHTGRTVVSLRPLGFTRFSTASINLSMFSLLIFTSLGLFAWSTW